MTCFSIHKSLHSFLGAALMMAVLAAFSPVLAQTDPPEALKKKILAEEEAKKLEESGKVDAPIVIELFTTSDCSACVFADRMLYDAMKDKKVIALSCHIQDTSELKDAADKDKVTENDNKGPMDPCVFRQWTYASNRASRDVTVNIPAFIFGGYDRVDATDLSYFLTTLNAYHYAYKNQALEAMMRWKDDDTLSIMLPQSKKADQPNASVWLIRYKDMEVQRMDEGINKGRVLRFSNIVQDIKHIGKWHGAVRTLDVDVPKPPGGHDRGGYVVLVAEMMGDSVLVAGQVDDYPNPNDIKKATRKTAVKTGTRPSPAQERAPTPPPGSAPPAKQ